MLSWLKRFAAPVAMLALPCLMPVAAFADSVTFHTVVFFTAAGTGSTLATTTNTNDTLNSTTTSDKLVANSVVTNTEMIFPDGSETGTSFGNFTMTGASADKFIGASLEVDVYQDATVPPSGGTDTGNSMFVGKATATFRAAPNQPSDTVLLVFNSPLSFTLPPGAGGFPPGVIYRIDGTQTLRPLVPALDEIRGGVSEMVVPLPATANIGLVLLAGVGGFAALRRRRTAVEV